MQTAQRGAGEITPSDTYDLYEEFLRAGSTGDYIRAYGLEQLPWVARTMAHPAYDEYWQGMAVEPVLVARPSKVPTLWTQGLWDQEDMWGANHAWRALKAAGHDANNWLVLGPWNHVQVGAGGTSLGPMKWEANTSVEYQRNILLPFLNEHLRDGPPAKLSRVTVYNTARNAGNTSRPGRPRVSRGCATGLTPLYMGAELQSLVRGADGRRCRRHLHQRSGEAGAFPAASGDRSLPGIEWRGAQFLPGLGHLAGA